MVRVQKSSARDNKEWIYKNTRRIMSARTELPIRYRKVYSIYGILISMPSHQKSAAHAFDAIIAFIRAAPFNYFMYVSFHVAMHK